MCSTACKLAGRHVLCKWRQRSGQLTNKYNGADFRLAPARSCLLLRNDMWDALLGRLQTCMTACTSTNTLPPKDLFLPDCAVPCTAPTAAPRRSACWWPPSPCTSPRSPSTARATTSCEYGGASCFTVVGQFCACRAGAHICGLMKRAAQYGGCLLICAAVACIWLPIGSCLCPVWVQCQELHQI